MLSRSFHTGRTCLHRFRPRFRVPSTLQNKDDGAQDHTYSAHIMKPALQSVFPIVNPLPEPGSLQALFTALQKQDLPQLADAFIAWTNLLHDESLVGHKNAVLEAKELRATTVSEILHSLDPVLNPDVDDAHGIAITLNHAERTPLHAFVNEFGVRIQHVQVLTGIKVLRRLRTDAPFCISDYETMMRCAGAAGDTSAVVKFFAATSDRGRAICRTPRTWKEFMKARFLTDAVYYQYDMNRVALSPRELHSLDRLRSFDTLVKMDQQRFEQSLTSSSPWGRIPQNPQSTVLRGVRHRHGPKSYLAHFRRALTYGLRVDEEFLCLSMIAFARSGRLRSITDGILFSFYGINCSWSQGTYPIHIEGGHIFPSDSPLRPTRRLLEAIVDSFGAMAKIQICAELMQHVSALHDVAIPPSTWSRLLQWAYLYTTPHKARQLQVGLSEEHPGVSNEMLMWVWTTMTSEPFFVEPSADDCYVYAQTLISMGDLEGAITAVRDRLIPIFRRAEDEYRTAVLEEVLVNDTQAFPSAGNGTHARRRTEARLDHIRYCITHILESAVRLRSAPAVPDDDRYYEESNATNRINRSPDTVADVTMIADLIGEFGEFLPHVVCFETDQGYAKLERLGVVPRWEWAHDWRQTLPTKLSYYHIGEDGRFDEVPDDEEDRDHGHEHELEGIINSSDGEYDDEGADQDKIDAAALAAGAGQVMRTRWWPNFDELRVLDRRLNPTRRHAYLGRPPLPVDMSLLKEMQDPRGATAKDYRLRHSGIVWFGMLERELML